MSELLEAPPISGETCKNCAGSGTVVYVFAGTHEHRKRCRYCTGTGVRGRHRR